jgi:indole-3-glycerol phosphate synthase
MRGERRFSQAIAEGDGISLVVEVDDAETARQAESEGAEAVLVHSGREGRLAEIRTATDVPVLFSFGGQRAADLSGADACLVDGGREWLERVHGELAEEFELVVRVRDDEQLKDVLEHFDPEILLLASEAVTGERPLETVLELLPDVPAGKLAVADVGALDREALEELERAGVDAVILTSAVLGELAPPSG